MKRSNCCSYPIKENTDLCGMCSKHCEALEDSTFYIVKYDLELMCSATKSIDDYEIIKELKYEVKFESGIIKIDDKFYRLAYQDFKLNVLAVEEIEKPPFEETSLCDDEITCPNCKSSFSDSWEYPDSDTLECDTCGSSIVYQRDLEVTYSSNVVRANKNIKEL